MKRSIQKLHFLWVLSGIFGLLLVFWQDFDSGWNTEKPGFIHLLDRHWLLLKQSIEKKWLRNKMPSNNLVLYEPYYSNRSDFWFDEAHKQVLFEKLKAYEGSIVLNLDPVRLAEDRILSPLLAKPNLIRSFYISERERPDLQLELKIAKVIHQSGHSLLNDHLGLIPNRPEYFADGHRFGSLGYVQDSAAKAAQFVANYPLVQKGSRYHLPSLVLAAYMADSDCTSFKLEDQTLFCENMVVPTSLPLYFYRSNLRRVKEASAIENSTASLFINPIDASSEISAVDGRKITWGVLAGTALSNLIQQDYPWRNSWIRFAEIFIFVLFFLIIIYFSIYGRTRSCITAAFLCLSGFLLFDLVLSLATGARTFPIEGFVGLLAFSVVGLSLRASQDFDERRLIERALSGYVSQERLHRLLQGKDRLQLEGRNREMTTLLLDIVGFSKISKELGHQKVFAFVQRFFAFVDPIIFKHGGTIDKKTGDGLLAFFGDYENEDRPQEAALAAVRAAMEIQRQLESIKGRSQEFFGLSTDVECRIGVNSGFLMIGNAGSERHFNYTVLGDTVNFTQRLEAACPPGEVLIGSETWRLVENHFQISKREIPVKGETSLYTAGLVSSTL